LKGDVVVLKTILVPVDGSEQAEQSFKTAVEIAKRNNAKNKY